MNEAGHYRTKGRTERIDPALKEAGRGVVDGSCIRREVFTRCGFIHLSEE